LILDISPLIEHNKPCEIDLSAVEVDTLRQHFSKQVDVWPSMNAGRYWLKTHSYVGMIVLPTGRTITIEPKVSISTLFALLARVYDPTKQIFEDKPQPYTTVKELFEFIVSFYVNHTEELIARGLLRGYQSQIEDTPAIRGRLLIVETLHARPGLYDRHRCSYRHFTSDIPENRILLWTTYNLRAWKYVEADLHSRLYRIQHLMTDVRLDPSARLLYDRLEFHRLNDFYQPALALAKLILDHLSFSGAHGKEPFMAYLIDMNALFQKYLAVILDQELGKAGYSIREEERHSLDWDKKIPVEPDVILYQGTNMRTIIDAKYKLKEDEGDLYQMLAYCHALNLNQAILVHPDHENAPKGEILMRGPGNIHVTYLQLNLRGGPKELDDQAGRLARNILNIIT
jgi:5-methylcytosine-specific restriction enzyme subunit McrC